MRAETLTKIGWKCRFFLKIENEGHILGPLSNVSSPSGVEVPKNKQTKQTNKQKQKQNKTRKKEKENEIRKLSSKFQNLGKPEFYF